MALWLQVAEGLGDSCCYYCLLGMIPIVNIVVRINQRGRLRERQGIDGGCMGDALRVIFCAFCSLTQEAQECKTMMGAMAMDIERE